MIVPATKNQLQRLLQHIAQIKTPVSFSALDSLAASEAFSDSALLHHGPPGYHLRIASLKINLSGLSRYGQRFSLASQQHRLCRRGHRSSATKSLALKITTFKWMAALLSLHDNTHSSHMAQRGREFQGRSPFLLSSYMHHAHECEQTASGLLCKSCLLPVIETSSMIRFSHSRLAHYGVPLSAASLDLGLDSSGH